jgi:death-on-curing protein
VSAAAPPATDFLTLADLLDLVAALGAGPVRDPGLLDSACHRPQATSFGQDAYPTLPAKAAALMHSIARNHPLADGNKRLALLAAAVFLRMAGYDLDLTDEQAFELTMSVAEGDLDADALAGRMRITPAGAGA